MTTPFVSRAEWGARPRKAVPAQITSEGVTAHYGGPSPWGPGVDRSSAARFMATADHARCASICRAWQAFHMDGRGWNDIAYNSMVCPHGHRFDGRGVGVRSGAQGTNDGNARSEAVCYIAGEGDPLTDPAKDGFLDEAVRMEARSLRWIHSDWHSTACPGAPIRLWQAQGWPDPTPPPPDPTPTPPTTEDDLMFIITPNGQGTADDPADTNYRTRLIAPPLAVPLSTQEIKDYKAKGVVVLPTSKGTATLMLDQVNQALTDEDVVAAIEAADG